MGESVLTPSSSFGVPIVPHTDLYFRWFVDKKCFTVETNFPVAVVMFMITILSGRGVNQYRSSGPMVSHWVL